MVPTLSRLFVIVLFGTVNCLAIDSLVEQFEEPGPAYRGKPFWSWNGELEEVELKRQIKVMQDMGLGGFFMHSRTGLATEYLGDEWFELTNVCADEGQRLDMEAWLYDEDRWPSGTAGGRVTHNPDYRLKFISLRTVPANQFGWTDGIYAAFACDLDGLAFKNCQRITNDTPSSAFPNKTILVFTIEEMAKSSFYNGYTMADTMNREATDYYIELTHEQYLQRCGDRFGKSIKGIFTDEPHRGCVMGNFGIDNANQRWMTPWTGVLANEFSKRFGYDLVEGLPDLFLQREGKRVSPIKWHYMELCQQLFLENWLKPIYDWCTENNLLLTGHALHEDSLTAQTSMQGSLMRFYEYEHVPGVDCLTEGNRNYWVVKQLSSAARQLDRPWMMSELYGVTGWQFDFKGHKAVGDWQALFGINLRCHHLSWYTMEGQAKRDYPASMLHQSAWYNDYSSVETYFARLGLMLQQGRPYCDLLVINPVESLWCQIHADWINNIVTPKDPEVRQLEKAYRDLFHWLAGHHIDFDYGDEEMMSRLCRIKQTSEGTFLYLGQAAYRTILVPQMTTIRSSTLKILNDFHQAGGKVIFAGNTPPYVNAVESKKPLRMAMQMTQCAWEPEAIVSTVKQQLPPQVEIVNQETGQSLTDVFCQMRQNHDKTILIAMNVNREKAFNKVLIRIPGNGHVTEWDCQTGKRFSVAAKSNQGILEFTTSFPVVGEHVYVVTSKPCLDIKPKPQLSPKRTVKLSGPFDYRLKEDNVCVLDFAKYKIDDQPWQAPKEVLKVDQAIRTHFDLAHRGGQMVQPWFAQKYHAPPPILGQINLAFEFNVDAIPDSQVKLGIEHPEQVAITLNGKSIKNNSDGWWVDKAIQTIPLPDHSFVKGTNKLQLQMSFSEDKGIEALYLLGKFGVKIDGRETHVVALPKQLQPSDIVTQGLPFYSGAVEYCIPLSVQPTREERLSIQVPGFSGACVKVSSNHEDSQLIAWPPYEANITKLSNDANILKLEVVLTRRNSFGPLHLVPKNSGAYGPGHWITDGKKWTDTYQLWPAGLLQSPEIVLSEINP